MKHKLNRDHLHHKKGDSIELTPEQEQYFERVGLIKGEEKEKVVAKPKKEKKDKAGPNAKK